MTTLDEKAEEYQDQLDFDQLDPMPTESFKAGYAQAIEDLKAKWPSDLELKLFCGYPVANAIYSQGNREGIERTAEWLREQLFKENE
jgi:hypothetical protein